MIRMRGTSRVAASIISGILICTACLAGCAPKGAVPVSRSSFLLNTYVTVTIYGMEKDNSQGQDEEQVLEEAMKLCADYEKCFSRTIETSELSRLNHRNVGTRQLWASDEMAQLVEKGLQYGEMSQGAFDITIEPVSSLWDFSGNDPHVPDQSQLDEALGRVDYQAVSVLGDRIFFQRDDTALDLGGIAKGFIADRIKEYLKSQGVKSAVINLGGNVLCLGGQPEGRPFQIGIRKPFGAADEAVTVVEVSDMSVVSSGTYERCFTEDGVTYHHLLNPSTGYPFENNLTQVTILSNQSVDGDGLSTACFGLGLEQGIRLLDSLEGVYGIFVTQDGELYYSKGAKDFVRE